MQCMAVGKMTNSLSAPFLVFTFFYVDKGFKISKYIETLDQKTLVVLICAGIVFLWWQMCEKAISMESMFGNNSLAHSRLLLPYFYQQ